MKGFTKLIIVLTAALLAACAGKPGNEVPVAQHNKGAFPDETMRGRVLFLQCTGGYEFPAHIQRDEAWLFLPEGTKRLVPEKSTAGRQYSNGEYRLWLNQHEAMLEVGELAIKQCRNNQKKAVWEEARLRGADFRAVGNNPEWSLELSLDGNTVFVGDNGSTRVLFKTTEPVIDGDKRTSTYQMNNGKQKMTVQIEGKSCHDPVSGELFDTTVTIHMGGKILTGCGRALR